MRCVRLEAIPSYPVDYDKTVNQVRAENAQDYSPPIKDNIPDLAVYDVISLGTPVWANQLSLPVKTFLNSANLAGKLILPFATYIVSSQGRSSRSQIIKMQPKANVAPILTVLGADAANAKNQVTKWLTCNTF